MRKFWIQNHFCAILGGRDIYKTKCGSETDQFIFALSHSGLKTAKFSPSSKNWPKTGPDSSQVTPSGPSNPIWLNKYYDWFILIIFKNFGSSKSNNLSFDQNHLIKNPILFCKYLSPRILHRNCSVFKIYRWISVFRRKKQFVNLLHGLQAKLYLWCRRIHAFFLKRPVACPEVAEKFVWVVGGWNMWLLCPTST